MAGLNAQLSPLTVPEGTEFPGSVQSLLQLISEYIAVVGLENFEGVNYGVAEPSADDRDLAWFRTDGGGNPIGWYGWDGSAWVLLPQVMPSGPTADRPVAPTTSTQFFDTDISCALIYYSGSWRTLDGCSGDVKYVVGTDLAAVLVLNPGWVHYTNSIGRTLVGAQADGSDAGTDAGAAEMTLTEAELPTHTHEDIVLTGSEADSGDAGNFVIVAATQSIGTRTITASQTGPKGDGDAFSLLPPSRYLFCLLKE